MKNTIKIAIALVGIVAFGITSTSYAQEWTNDQLEVWGKVEKGWESWQKHDAVQYNMMLHEQYQAWNNETPLPADKKKMREWFNMAKEFMTIHMYDISPARIAVTENAAVVDYYYNFYATWSWGDHKEEKEMKGRIAEFWIKEKGEWKLLGDMGAHDDEEDDD
jgi:hypothetical protein